MTHPREPFLGWPGWRIFAWQQTLTLLCTVVFLVFYGGSSRLASTYGSYHTVHAAWELQIPFVPEVVPLYLSIHLLLALAPFVFRSVPDLAPFAVTLCAITVVASICFVLFPTAAGFQRPPVDDKLFNLADALNMEYNQVPSLHIALSSAAAIAYRARCKKAFAAFFYFWVLGIAVSTLLIHEHHLLDIVTGCVLGIAAMRWLYPYFVRCVPPLIDRAASKRWKNRRFGGLDHAH